MNYKTTRHILSMVISLALGAALFLTDWPGRVNAAPGDFDLTFDSNGRLATDFNDGEDAGKGMVIQPDGKIIIVGPGNGVSTVFADLAIARYNPNGSLDTTFSFDGKLIMQNMYGYSRVVALQPDGKIVIAVAYAQPLDPNIVYVARLNANGSLDTAFAGDGRAETPTGQGAATQVRDVIIQPDGRILVVGGWGQVGGSIPNDWLILRYHSNGDVDTGFSGDGQVETDFGGNTGEFAAGAAILPGGRILVAGTGSPAGQDFAIALYTSNGSLDTNWGGGDGKIVTDFAGGNDVVNGMKLMADGRIVLVGSSVSGGEANFAVARYNADGTPDTSFDGDGRTTTNISPAAPDSAMGVAVQADGKIVAVGENGTDFVLARYNTNGSLDAGFGQSGIRLSDMNNGSDDDAAAIKIQTDGKLVVTGSCKNSAVGSTSNFCVARYLSGLGSRFDYDGDARADISVFRPSNGSWYINGSTGGFQGMAFGVNSDKIAPADYDGDGKTDIAVYRPSEGRWYIANSSNGVVISYIFGLAEDLPAPADYDGDARADISIFRPSIGTWYRQNSSNGSFFGIQFGSTGDRPTVGDFDGDGKADIGIWRPSNGDWYHIRSSNGTVFGERFGISTDKMVPADYDGDGKTDIAVWRPSSGIWYIKNSATSAYTSHLFGLPTDLPAPGDFDGDGKADRTVWRPSDGTWYITNSTNGSFTIFPWGQNGDRPTPNAFLN